MAQTADISYTYDASRNRTIRATAIKVLSMTDSVCVAEIAQFEQETAGKQESVEKQVTEVNDTELQTGTITVFPNPANTELNISTTGDIPLSVALYEPNGKEVLSMKPSSANTRLNVSGIAVGHYILKVERKEGVESFIIVKE